MSQLRIVHRQKGKNLVSEDVESEYHDPGGGQGFTGI